MPPTSPHCSRPAWRPRQHAGTVGGLIGLLLLFATVTAGVAFRFPPLVSIDQGVARWAYNRTYSHSDLSAWWTAVTTYGQPIVLRALLVVVTAFQAWRRRWDLVIWLIGLVIVENVVAPLMKYAFARPRPHWRSPIRVEHSLSYPSGHAAAAGMLITAITVLTIATVRNPLQRLMAISAAMILGVLISASRIFLGVHYLSDVVAGLLLGSTLALLCYLVVLQHQDTREPRPDQP